MAECTISQLCARSRAAWATAALLMKNSATSSTWTLTGQRDRPAIAALQASSARLLDGPGTAAAQRNVRHVIRQLLSRHGRNAA